MLCKSCRNVGWKCNLLRVNKIQVSDVIPSCPNFSEISINVVSTVAMFALYGGFLIELSFLNILWAYKLLEIMCIDIP